LTNFWKILKHQFHENPSRGSQVLPCRPDKPDNHFLQFSDMPKRLFLGRKNIGWAFALSSAIWFYL